MTASLSLTTRNSNRSPLPTIPMTPATHSDLNSYRFIMPMTANAVDSNQKHGIYWIYGILLQSRSLQTQPICYFDSPSSERTLLILRDDLQLDWSSQVWWSYVKLEYSIISPSNSGSLHHISAFCNDQKVSIESQNPKICSVTFVRDLLLYRNLCTAPTMDDWRRRYGIVTVTVFWWWK